jgi:hypothetical protein
MSAAGWGKRDRQGYPQCLSTYLGHRLHLIGTVHWLVDVKDCLRFEFGRCSREEKNESESSEAAVTFNRHPQSTCVIRSSLNVDRGSMKSSNAKVSAVLGRRVHQHFGKEEDWLLVCWPAYMLWCPSRGAIAISGAWA